MAEPSEPLDGQATGGKPEALPDVAQRFEEISRAVADAARGMFEGTPGDLNRLLTLPIAADGNLPDMRKSLADLVEGVVQTNLRAAQELLRLDNPVAVIEWQQRFASEYLQALMRGTAILVGAIHHAADGITVPSEAPRVAEREQNEKRRP